MNAPRPNTRYRSVGIILFRAFCSTVVVAALVSGVIVVHEGRFQLEEIKGVWWEYWPLLAITFFALSIWDYWLQRTARSRQP